MFITKKEFETLKSLQNSIIMQEQKQAFCNVLASIAKRNEEQLAKIAQNIKEKRKNNPLYGRSKKQQEKIKQGRAYKKWLEQQNLKN